MKEPLNSHMYSASIAVMLCISIAACQSDSPPEPASLDGLVTDFVSNAGLEGATLCWHIEAPTPTSLDAASSCVVTDNQGAYRIDLMEANQNGWLTARRQGYVTGIANLRTGSGLQTVPPLSLTTPTLFELQGQLTNTEAVGDTGSLVFSVSNGIPKDKKNVPNIQVSLTPKAGDGPFYLGSNSLPDLSASKTSINGGGLILNLPNGSYELRHDGLIEPCDVLLGHGTAQTVRAQVVPGWVTFVRIECPAPSGR
ncbi:MAG TPA: hypothetical protein DCQ06_05215 [Myxococcales bacterium]|nr:hypothetical protein [Myxococcales bacterium]